MIDLKPYGAFVEHTLRPFLEEAQELLDRLEEKGFYFNKRNIDKLVNGLIKAHLIHASLDIAKSIVITVIVCLTAWLICQN